MNALQKALSEQFGPGRYLTNSSVDWSDPLTFEPRPQPGMTPLPDRLIDPAQMPFGEGALSIGFNRAALHYGAYDGISVFGQILKFPGETRHRVPRQLEALAPVLRMIADHEFSVSSSAIDKICRIAARVLPLRADVKQIAQDVWHTHGILTSMTAQRAESLEIDLATLENMEAISPRFVQNEYIFSDRAGTLVQTARSRYPMSIKSTNGDTILVMSPPEKRQAAPGEILRMNSYVFHAAAKPKPEDLGHARTMLLVCYTGTKKMESRLRAA